MRQVNVSVVVAASCDAVFDVLEDLSRRPAFTDHYLKDFRLARPNPRGIGASARFLLARPLLGERAEVRIVECERPTRVVEQGALGRRGRSTLSMVYELTPEADGGCRVHMATLFEPKTAVDRLRMRGANRWARRHGKRAMGRLRRMVDHPPEGEQPQVTVAGYEPHTAPRFGDHVRGAANPAAADG